MPLDGLESDPPAFPSFQGTVLLESEKANECLRLSQLLQIFVANFENTKSDQLARYLPYRGKALSADRYKTG